MIQDKSRHHSIVALLGLLIISIKPYYLYFHHSLYHGAFIRIQLTVSTAGLLSLCCVSSPHQEVIVQGIHWELQLARQDWHIRYLLWLDILSKTVLGCDKLSNWDFGKNSFSQYITILSMKGCYIAWITQKCHSTSSHAYHFWIILQTK